MMNAKDLSDLNEVHQFVRDDEYDIRHGAQDYKVRMARKYYDQLYKEYAIIDLSRYEEGMIGLRWRTEAEVIAGKGQYSCAAKACNKMSHKEVSGGSDQVPLDTFELPFSYQEQGVEKLELVKVRLCGDCAEKLCYYRAKQRHKRDLGNSDEYPNNDERPKKKRKETDVTSRNEADKKELKKRKTKH